MHDTPILGTKYPDTTTIIRNIENMSPESDTILSDLQWYIIECIGDEKQVKNLISIVCDQYIAHLQIQEENPENKKEFWEQYDAYIWKQRIRDWYGPYTNIDLLKNILFRQSKITINNPIRSDQKLNRTLAQYVARIWYLFAKEYYPDLDIEPSIELGIDISDRLYNLLSGY